ncbi:MAG: glycosyltransferase family 2 protein [Methanomicrobiales archaeon]
MKISVIVPMYNEEENVVRTLTKIDDVIKKYEDYEILVIDDGSIDKTSQLVSDFQKSNPNVQLIKHAVNAGRGRALRTGFDNVSGDIIVTTDADLSYDAEHIPLLADELIIDESADIIVGSPYMKGGGTENVPALRLWISKIANKFVGFAMGGDLRTVTGILRAYRIEVLDSLELESDGKEIHLEILSKAVALGYKIKETPATLKGRELGRSKIKFRATAISHILFSFYERPMILFGSMGLVLCFVGMLIGIYLFYLYMINSLNPERPLMILMILLVLGGIQVIVFGFVATQISLLKREIYIIQKENKMIRKKLFK